MSPDRIIVFETFADPIQANIVKGLLESYGIECFLTDENVVTLNALYANAVGGVKLNVFEKDVDRISAILASENIVSSEQVSAEEKKADNVICPKCHSSNVSYGGSVNRKFGYRDIFLSFLLMVYPFTMRKRFHCFDCNHEFKA